MKRVLLALVALSLAAFPGCQGIRYIVSSAVYQTELLASRVPLDEVRAFGDLTEDQLAALDRIDDIRAFGADIGLSQTNNYRTLAVDWDNTIYALSACDPLSFEPRTWRFPIVGRVPYLGFFDTWDVAEAVDRLERDGYEVYVRTAAAYSTLGWFRDPILPGMLRWEAFDLADIVLHELTHATVWIPGSVNFNESFANFVGEEAAFRYIADRFGADSPQYAQAVMDNEDLERWREMQHGLYQDLEALYASDLSDAEKLARKAELFASVPDRIRGLGLHEEERFLRYVDYGVWNNARMIQFRTYNNDTRDAFAVLLERNDGDLLAFMDEVRDIARGADDPYVAVRVAAGLEPTE